MQPLFERLIDFAGVFPPANLPVEEATRQYRRAVSSHDGWIMGPMLLRASQVGEFRGTEPIGIVADAQAIGDFTQVEKACDPESTVATISSLLGSAPVVYIESTLPADMSFLDAISSERAGGHDVRAKIRTGGVSASAFPLPSEVAAFILACVERSVPFKATAGLHHPIRIVSEVEGATEHGFINMLAAVRCALSGDAASTVACLAETDPAAFDLTTGTWQGIGTEVTEQAIREVFVSIGSCSFDEPTGYLRQLGLI